MKKNKPVIPKQSIICQEKKRKVTYINTQCLQAKQINVNWTCTHGLSRKNARGRPQVAKIAHPENMQAATSSSPGASKSCKFLFNVRRTCPQINGKADPFNKRVKRHNEEISPLSALLITAAATTQDWITCLQQHKQKQVWPFQSGTFWYLQRAKPIFLKIVDILDTFPTILTINVYHKSSGQKPW